MLKYWLALNKPKIVYFSLAIFVCRYVAVLVWIPELFARYYDFKLYNSDDVCICEASDWLLKYDNTHGAQPVSEHAYFAALFVAVTMIPLIILVGITVKYVNKKILLCTYTLIYRYVFNI